MLRTTAPIIKKAKAPAKPSNAIANALSAKPAPTAAPLVSSMYSMNMLSPIDGPMYIPECDDGGKNEQSNIPKEPVATTTVMTTNDKGLLSSLLRPQPGTNAYDLLHSDAPKAAVAPGFLQRVVFGTADYLLDKTSSTESATKPVQMMVSTQEAVTKPGLLHSIYYGVPAEALDARVEEMKATVVAWKSPANEDEVNKLLDEADRLGVANQPENDKGRV